MSASCCSRCHGSRSEVGPGLPGRPFVCPGCLASLRQQWGPPWVDGRVEGLDPPVLVVDQEGRLVAANPPLAALLGRAPGELVGLLLGEALGCARSRLPGGCGRAAACAACAIHRTVRLVRETGLERIAVAAELRGEAGRSDLHLSALPFQGFVKVVLHEFRPERPRSSGAGLAPGWRPEPRPEPEPEPGPGGADEGAPEGGPPDLLQLIGLRELQGMQDAFAEATGVASLITDPAGAPLTQPSRFCRLCRELVRTTPAGLARCTASDAALGAVDVRGPSVHACLSAGLLDGGTAICVGDVQVGSWLIGQVVDEDADEAALLARADLLGIDRTAYGAALAEVPRMSRRRFEAATQALFAFAQALSTAVTHTHRQAVRLVERRRADADQARLRAQLAQAQRLESLGRLAGGVAHDFNNVLSPILCYGQLLLQETGADDPRRELLEEVVLAGRRARDLSRQLLSLGRPRAAERLRRPLGDVVRGLQRLLERTLREDIRLETRLPDGGDEVDADTGQLEQVLLNLALNAQDAMPAGGELFVEVTPAPGGQAGAGWVGLSVLDTGAGMDRATLQRAFEPYFTTKQEGQGTGLGLFVVRDLVERHGGRVSATSRPGQGTAVEIRLPAARALASDVAEAGRAASAGDLPRARPGERVVVVDDDEGVLRCATELLRHLGYDVVPVGDPERCLELFEREGPQVDLVLADVIMPKLTGPELRGRLAGRARPPRVLFMSGHLGLGPLPGRAGGEAAMAMLEKPLTLERLARQVRATLDAPGR